MTYIEAQTIAETTPGGTAELLSARLKVGHVLGGKFWPLRKVVQVLGKPTGRPQNTLPQLWMVTVKEPTVNYPSAKDRGACQQFTDSGLQTDASLPFCLESDMIATPDKFCSAKHRSPSCSMFNEAL